MALNPSLRHRPPQVRMRPTITMDSGCVAFKRKYMLRELYGAGDPGSGSFRQNSRRGASGCRSYACLYSSGRGTFYAAGSYCGQVVDGVVQYCVEDLPALSRAGHEVGCQTFNHRRVSTPAANALNEEIDLNTAFFARHLPHVTMHTFAIRGLPKRPIRPQRRHG
jgi:hypothetical protein